MRIRSCLTSLLAVHVIASASTADVVTDWNTMWLQAIRATGGPPCPIARAGAILHVAMYDAINSIEQTHEPYFMFEDVAPTTSKEAAAAMAAHRVLSLLYPDPALQSLFDDQLQAHLDAIPDGPEEDAGMALGMSCANGIMALRESDGSDIVMEYEPAKKPGDWIPTPPDFTMPFNPDWPGVTPWTMLDATQFRPFGPAGYDDMKDLLRSPEYTEAYNEVKSLGDINSTERTDEQTLIARFWANDRDGTYKPPGHLNFIAQVIAAQQGNTLSENARLFALLNLALADAGIVAWDCKYATPIDLWRPVTGIRKGHRDHNQATERDPDWSPLSDDPAVNGFTPPFPAWISGHATFAATFAAVLREFYGTDEITFTITSDDTPGVERTYHSLAEAAWENAMSRIYLGVHWRMDAEDGNTAGTELGEWVVDNYLLPIAP
jgi:hypothetical protein